MSMREGDRGGRSAAVGIGDPPAMTAATAALAEARLDRFLSSEPVVWLSTVRPDGAPHLVPIWFTWDGSSLLVFSKPGAQKVRNLRANPVAMLALGEPEDDFDVALAEARVELFDAPATDLPDAHLVKYADRMAALGLSPEEFVATYSQVIRITPTRSLPWHGRTTPRSVLAVATIEEPVPAVVRQMHGEPIGPCPTVGQDELAREEPPRPWWSRLLDAVLLAPAPGYSAQV
jgi:PPOX class probable F420-dependent enzyme